MCLLCVELTKDSLKASDFIRNYSELSVTDPKHAEEVAKKFKEKVEKYFAPSEQEENEEDPFNFLFHDNFWD